MTIVHCLLITVFSVVIRAQDTNPLLTYWNTPPLRTPAIDVQPEAKLRVVLLHDSAQVDFPGSTRVADGSKSSDGSWVFLLNNTKTSQVLKFKLTPREGEPAVEGIFRLFLGHGYPAYEFVNGSDAEKELLMLLRRCRDAVTTSQGQSSPSETLDALNTLLEYFPAHRQNNKQNKPEMATPNQPPE